MKPLIIFCGIILLAGCASRSGPSPDTIVSMQTLDRNGFSETISSPERLSVYQNVDFTNAQPYQKVLRVYGRDEQGKSHSQVSSYHANGHIWQLLECADGRANGLFREWYENGALKITAHVIEGIADLNERAQKSWLFDKESKAFDAEGNQVAEFTYERGALQGDALYYHKSGLLAKKLPYDKGALHGTCEVFNEEGFLIEETLFQKGLKDGAARSFWSANTLRFQEQYRQGLLLSALYYDKKGEVVGEIANGEGSEVLFEGGQVAREITYVGGKPEGLIKIYRQDGRLQTTFCVKDELKHGEEWEYYPGQAPKLFINWHEGSIQGMVKTWYENGILESEREISQNDKHGLSFAYYKTGDLMLVEEYEKNKLVKGSYYKQGEKTPTSQIERGSGLATLFTQDGNYLKKVEYEQGKPIPK